MNDIPCACGNEMQLRRHNRDVVINGKTYSYERETWYCPQCGEEWATPAQADKTTRQIAEIKRHAHGFLSPADIAALRERHGLTQEQAAQVFGTALDSFARYESGTTYPTRAMDYFLRLFDTVPEARAQLLARQHAAL